LAVIIAGADCNFSGATPSPRGFVVSAHSKEISGQMLRNCC
jgi:hypothetical protein